MGRKSKIIEVDGRTKPNFLALFKEAVKTKTTSSYNHNDYTEDWEAYNAWWTHLGLDCLGPSEDDDYGFDGLDNFMDDDWYKKNKKLCERYGIRNMDDDCPPYRTRKKRKTHKTVSEETKKKIEEKKRKKTKEIVVGPEDDYSPIDTSLDCNKTIRFYRDYENPDDYEEFYDLYTFDEFCDCEGIEVSEEEVKNLMFRDMSYCCIDPCLSRENGTPMLITDSSYGGLRWACAESDDELAEAFSSEI